MFDKSAPGVQTSLVNLTLESGTVWETTAVFTVRIANENPSPMQIEGAVHKIYVNGAYIGQGMSGEPIDVPKLDSITQVFHAHLRNLSLATRVRPLIESRRFEYRIDSILYSSPGHRRLRLSNSGVLDLNDFQPRGK